MRLWLLPTLLFALAGSASADNSAALTEIGPNLLQFGTASGNVIVSVGPDGAFLVGIPSAASTSQISSVLKSRTSSPARYLVVFPHPLSDSQGDAGWGKLGAFVAMQENALDRLGGHHMTANSTLPLPFIQLGVDRPRMAFSDVLSFDLNGDSIHVVHQPPGYSDADSIVHFHTGHLIYMGEVFPGDGYPQVETGLGGKLDGIINTLSSWTNEKMSIAPARGKITTGADVKTFRDMIVTVRDRLKSMIASGRTEEQAVAQHPTAEFDGRYGHGRVTPDAFVREVYAALKQPNPQPADRH